MTLWVCQDTTSEARHGHVRAFDDESQTAVELRFGFSRFEVPKSRVQRSHISGRAPYRASAYASRQLLRRVLGSDSGWRG